MEREALTADAFLSEIVGIATALVKTYNCVAVLEDTGGQCVNFTMEFTTKKK